MIWKIRGDEELVGAPEGAEAGESSLLLCSGLLKRLRMNNFSCSHHILVSHVPRQDTHITSHTLAGEGADPGIKQLINLSLVPRSSLVSLHCWDTRQCRAHSCSFALSSSDCPNSRCPSTAVLQPLERKPLGRAATHPGTPALPMGTASSSLGFSSCKSLRQQVGHGLDGA